MNHVFRLALQSAYSRRAALSLVMLSILATACMLVVLEQLRVSARVGFSQSVSGTDLVVGARDNPLSLMLYSVFRMGEPTQQLPYAIVEKLNANSAVQWVVPLSLGDSFHGYPVVGTSPTYFEVFGYGEDQSLEFSQGRAFGQYVPGAGAQVLYEAVLGAQVASAMGLKPGDSLTLAHGTSIASRADHADKPFTVVGVLKPTGTPVDRSVHVSLEALEAIHLNWQGGVPMRGLKLTAEQVTRFDLQPKAVTSLLLGLKNRAMVFRVKRQLETDPDVAMTAAMPGVELARMWGMVGQLERLLIFVISMVGLVSLLGLVSVMLVALKTRQRELMILRSIGASRFTLTGLLLAEAFVLMLLGCGLGLLVAAGIGSVAEQNIQEWTGLGLVSIWQLPQLGWMLGGYSLAGLVLGCVPAWQAYRQTVEL